MQRLLQTRPTARTYVFALPPLFLGAYLLGLVVLALLGHVEFTYDFVVASDRIAVTAWLVSLPIFGVLLACFELYASAGCNLYPLAPWVAVGAFVLLALTAADASVGRLLGIPALGALLAGGVLPHLTRARVHLWLERLLRRRGRMAPLALWVVFFAWIFTFSYHRFAAYAAGSLDLGVFTQTVWLLSRGLSPENTVMERHVFSDHAEFIDFAVVPLMWVWESPGSLLLLQALSLSLGVVGMYKFARRKARSAWAACAFAVLFPLLPGVQSAAMWDWNPETVAVGFIPWLFYFADSGRWGRAAAMLVLIGACKENLLLFTAMFGVFVFFYYRRWATGTLITGLSALAFWAEIRLFFPAFGGFRHVTDKGGFLLGGSFGGVFKRVLRNPASAFIYALSPGRKAVRLLTPFAALMFLPLALRYTFILVLSFLVTRYFTTIVRSWYGYFYGGCQETVLLICVVMLVPAVRRRLARVTLAGAAFGVPLLAACSVALYLVVTPAQWTDLFHFTTVHYPRAPQRAAYEEVLPMIPDDASVAAQDNLVPHLATRRHIYRIERDVIGRVDYILIDENGRIIPPLTVSRHEDFMKRVFASPQYECVFSEDGVHLFVRTSAPAAEPAEPVLLRPLGRPLQTAPNRLSF
jgi:uncharacterized membrane protein